jgi:acetyl esterase/lipase
MAKSAFAGSLPTEDSPFSVHTTLSEILAHPALESFGRLALPLRPGRRPPSGTLGETLWDLLPYHDNVNPGLAAQCLNHLVAKAERGERLFFDIYSDRDKNEDPSKKETGLFVLRGRPNAPTAIICAGGGFEYVGSIHEGFPHALSMSKRGLNAIVVHYRTGWEEAAANDLAKAIDKVFEISDELSLNLAGYSLWGSSAGARLVARLGSLGPGGFGLPRRPKPAAVIMAYTGYSDFVIGDPPTFEVVGRQDAIADPAVIEKRVRRMRSAGIDAELYAIEGCRPGFGLGIGTPAEGWLERALAFWLKRIPRTPG